MIVWELIESVKVPISGETLSLRRWGKEYSIDVDGSLLMNSYTHASEDALAEIACKRVSGVRQPSVLIGGLGMGYTLAAALSRLGPQAKVEVAELLPAVVAWNRGVLGPLAGRPLADKRVSVFEGDVATLLRSQRAAYDAILQDVDNGPEGLTMKGNDWLYSEEGLAAAAAALRPEGVMALWAAKPDKRFVKRMRRGGFNVDEVPVRGRDGQRGAHHIVWVAYLGPSRDFRRGRKRH